MQIQKLNYSYRETPWTFPFDTSQCVMLYSSNCRGSRNEAVYLSGNKLYQHCRVVVYDTFPDPQTVQAEYYLSHRTEYLGSFATWNWLNRQIRHVVRTQQATFGVGIESTITYPLVDENGNVVRPLELPIENLYPSNKYRENPPEFTFTSAHFSSKLPLVEWGAMKPAKYMMVEPLVDDAEGQIVVVYPFKDD